MLKKERQGIEKFLQLFFEKYAKGNTEELSVLMKEPVKTSGQATVSSIEEKELRFLKRNKKVLQAFRCQ